MRVWRYDPARDLAPANAGPGDLEQRAAVFVASSDEASPPVAWMAVDEYDGKEAALLFAAPMGDEFHSYVRALAEASVDEARALGFTSLLAHHRGGWATATPELEALGFDDAAPGIWRRQLKG